MTYGIVCPLVRHPAQDTLLAPMYRLPVLNGQENARIQENTILSS